MNGMLSVTLTMAPVKIIEVVVTDDTLSVDLEDGRTVAIYDLPSGYVDCSVSCNHYCPMGITPDYFTPRYVDYAVVNRSYSKHGSLDFAIRYVNF